MTIWRIRIAFRITKAANPHSQYVILTAFPLQQWLQEHASVLRYMYIACLVFYVIPFCGYVWVGLYMNVIGGIPSTLIEFLQYAYI
jgi:hypothetical protein